VKSLEEIVELYHQRRLAAGPVHAQMRRVRDLANGDVIVPLNELDKNAKTNVANLLVQGLDQMSMRIASTMPSPYFPPAKEGSDRSKGYARVRRTPPARLFKQRDYDAPQFPHAYPAVVGPQSTRHVCRANGRP